MISRSPNRDILQLLFNIIRNNRNFIYINCRQFSPGSGAKGSLTIETRPGLHVCCNCIVVSLSKCLLLLPFDVSKSFFFLFPEPYQSPQGQDHECLLFLVTTSSLSSLALLQNNGSR